MSNVTCRACKVPAVQADAGVARSIPYWYCRTCKNELDDYGWVVRKSTQAITELEDYLSGEIGRWDNEHVSIYDPFLKRNRMVPAGHPLCPPPTSLEPDEMKPEEDGDDAWYFNYFP